MTVTIEQTILRNLITNEEYSRKVLPYLKSEYFRDNEKVLFDEIHKFTLKYNKLPTIDALEVEINQASGLQEEIYKAVVVNLETFRQPKEVDNLDWLLDTSEKFCRDKAIYNALLASMEIVNKTGKNKLSEGAIPDIMSQAISVSFNPNVGLDYLATFSERWDYFHTDIQRYPLDIEILNKITKGGVKPATLNVLQAPPHKGKSLFLCHFAAAYLNSGYNVLYISMEMAKEEIANRIDANLLNLTLMEIDQTSKLAFESKAEDFVKRHSHLGKLIVEDFPTANASVINFRALVSDLRLKKNFIPQIIIVDYMNICSSARLGHGKNTNGYEYVGSIGQELRGFAKETNTAIWTATQQNRASGQSTDPTMEDVADSYGIPAIADFMAAIISTDDLVKLNQYLMKQLKNRYHNLNYFNKFAIGVDRDKMRLYDVENSAQDNIVSQVDPKQTAASKGIILTGTPAISKPDGKKGLDLLF